MNFSSNLRSLRKQHGMSQEDLANKLGYKSFTTIQKWESGVSEPSVSTVKRIAGIFGVTIDQMINENLNDFVPLQYSAQENELLNGFHHLSESQKARFLAYLDGLLDAKRDDLEAQMWEDADKIIKEEYESAAHKRADASEVL